MHFNELRHPTDAQQPIKIAVPRGSLWEPMREQLLSIGCEVCVPRKGGDGFCGKGFRGNWTNVHFYQRDRQIIPRLVTEGNFHGGITGEDLLVESGVCVRTLGRLPGPQTRWVIAVDGDTKLADGMTLGCELTQRFAPMLLDRLGRRLRIVQIQGYEEMAMDDGLCKAILVVTQTGRALKEHGLVIVPGTEQLFVSYPLLIGRTNLSGDALSAMEALKEALCR